MPNIDAELAGIVAQQSPAAFATTLATMAIDRSMLSSYAILDCFRRGWTSKDVSANPVLMAAFPYDREFTGQDQTILVHTNPDHDFRVVTARLGGETEIECVLVGNGFALVTRDLFRAGWSDWSSSSCSDVSLEDLLPAIEG
jgi:hypothetical protein